MAVRNDRRSPSAKTTSSNVTARSAPIARQRTPESMAAGCVSLVEVSAIIACQGTIGSACAIVVPAQAAPKIGVLPAESYRVSL